MHGEHNDGHSRNLSHLAANLQAVGFGHGQIGDDEVSAPGAKDVHGAVAVRRRTHFEAVALQAAAQYAHNLGLVIHHQDLRLLAAHVCVTSAAGTRKAKQLP